MVPVLFILIPLVSGMFSFLLKNEKTVKAWTLIWSVITLIISVLSFSVLTKSSATHFEAAWMPNFNSSFSVGLDGMSKMLCLLTAVAFPIIFVATWNTTYRKPNNFYALMMLSQAGLMGVFVSMDALLFYFFWELAIIPAYFLCSQWGGEKSVTATFKFFIYTFVGSILMLTGIIYVHLYTPGQSFALSAFYSVQLPNNGFASSWLFWLFFLAFAIKMPLFPFHTWQPDTYEQSPAATTMVLSGIMVKMGVFGILRWVEPVMPYAAWQWGDAVSTLCVVGMVYASLIALQQDDLKRLVAYSSIAHMGLMGLAIFVASGTGMQGVMIQMFSHGINIIGMWIVVDLIEKKFHTRKISELGGLAQRAPVLAILLVIVALANVALPLTNAFVGEFLMFTGIFTGSFALLTLASRMKRPQLQLAPVRSEHP